MTLRETLADLDDEILIAEGFDEALLGYASRGVGEPFVAVYDRDKCVQLLSEREGVTIEDAEVFFSSFVENSWVGDRTPLYVQKLEINTSSN